MTEVYIKSNQGLRKKFTVMWKWFNNSHLSVCDVCVLLTAAKLQAQRVWSRTLERNYQLWIVWNFLYRNEQGGCCISRWADEFLMQWLMTVSGLQLMCSASGGWCATGWAANGARFECRGRWLVTSRTRLWGHVIWIQNCIFSTQQAQRSSSDRRLLTVIGCRLGGCPFERQSRTFNAASVCWECQRSRALGVWSGGHLGLK